MSLTNISDCNKYFTEIAIKSIEELDHHSLDTDRIHNFKLPNVKVNWISLQAISGLISCGKNQCQKLLNSGLLVALNNLREQFPDIKIQSWIAQTLANLSVYKESHMHIWQTRWLRVIVEWLHSNRIELSLPAAKILYNLGNDSHSYLSESLYVLHPINSDFSDRSFDVVFVHGLLGGTFRTWRQCDANSTLKNYTRCWPKEWLANDINNIRILAVDYQTHLSNWNIECPSDKFTLKDRSEQLVSNLLLCEIGNKPIIWITHSMGGLLVKQILADIKQSIDPNKKKILEQTKGVVFYSVPHKGSEMAVWSPIIQSIISPSSEVLELRKGWKYHNSNIT
jgi:protein SERAC1